MSHEDFQARVHEALTEFGPQPHEGPWSSSGPGCASPAGALLAGKPEPVIYPKGSWGPAEADRLAEPIGWLLRS